ncbi:hypothetical protein [Paramagnetospirillum magnetotacticum]|uniref:hypothetical protein n=1 Tax=Paramagnetospirillum magnetotacticum TaxID=188 RepID=UPI0002E93ED0|nr:hypothetical protein [Paramagnetospirillum magnetotacticum]
MSRSLPHDPELLPGYLDKVAVAKALGLHPKTVERLPLPCVQIGRKKLYRMDALTFITETSDLNEVQQKLLERVSVFLAGMRQ